MKQIARSDARVRRARSSSVASLIEPLEGRQLLSAAIKVAGNGQTIAVKDKTPALTDATDFGPVTLKGSFSSSTRTYTVKNTGTKPLYLQGNRVSIGGSDASDFTLASNLPAIIKAGRSSSFTVKYDPTAKGNSSADITVFSNGNHTVYTYRITGVALKTTRYSNGLEVANTTTGTGSAAAAGMALKVNYTGFRQDGLVFDSSLKAGGSPFQFKLGATPNPQVIAGWDQGFFGTKVGDNRVLFIPSALGYGTVGSGASIPPNTPLIFTTSTLGIGPSIKVSGGTPSALIVDGDVTPDAADSTQFGARKKGRTTVHTFTVAADITATDAAPNFSDQTTPVHVTGVNASDFKVGALTSNNDGTVSFTVTFKPSSTGTRHATIDIPNNNPLRADYTFAIEGKGT